MSRFKAKEYQEVFNSPYARYRLKGKEKVLWKGCNKTQNVFAVVMYSLIVVMLLGLLYYLFTDPSDENETITIILMAGPLIGICVFLILYIVLCVTKRRSVLKSKCDISTDDFIARSIQLPKNKYDIIKASRDTLGTLYKIDPGIIYPSETPDILDICNRGNTPPYRIEFILGTAKRLGILLSDKEVDRIGARLSDNARTAEQLIQITCDELIIAQKQQQEMLQNQTYENKLAEIEQEGPLADNSKKSWTKKMIVPACFALIFFVVGIQALAENEKEKGVDKEMFIFVLIGMAICGFIIGWLIQLIIKIVNKYSLLRNVKNSIYFSIFCMLMVFSRENDSQENSFGLDELITILIFGVCGFLVARIAYRLGKRIDIYFKNKSNLSEEEKRRIDKDLKYLIDKSASKLYFNSILTDMVDQNERQRTVHHAKILPQIDGYDKPEPPLYGEFVNWLKELVDLEPRPYQAIQNKSIPLNLGDKKEKQFINVNVEFADAESQPYLRLQIEAL
jgi:RsiW-degrading membrane proteinase PrsW (M82 family)